MTTYKALIKQIANNQSDNPLYKLFVQLSVYKVEKNLQTTKLSMGCPCPYHPKD